MHTPGKDLTIANTLLHAPTTTASDADTQFNHNTVMSCLPATEKWLGLASTSNWKNWLQTVECCRNRVQNPERLLPVTFPKLPWQKVASDLFVWKNSHYLLVISYFSRYYRDSKAEFRKHSCCHQAYEVHFSLAWNTLRGSFRQWFTIFLERVCREYGFVCSTSSPI